MKKILINQPRSSYYTGGAEVVSLEHAKHLSLLGYEVTFITLLPTSIGEVYSAKYNQFKQENDNISTIEIPQQSEALFCYDIEPGESRDRWNIESIHYNRSLFTYLLSSKMTYDVCISYYKLDALVIPGRFINNNLLYLCGVPEKDNEFMSSFLSAYNTVLAITDEVKDYWQKYTNKPIRTVETGVDTDRFYPGHKNSKKLKILFMGRLIKRKGVDILIESLGLLPQDACNKIEVDIVGVGPMLKSLQDQVRNADLSHVVKFHGESSVPEKFFSTANVCVFPSRRGEGLQGVVLEGMSSGCYVLASDSKINLELLNDGRGSAIPVDSADRLSNELLRIVNNKDIIDNVTGASRDYVVNNYSWDKAIEKLEKYI